MILQRLNISEVDVGSPKLYLVASEEICVHMRIPTIVIRTGAAVLCR